MQFIFIATYAESKIAFLFSSYSSDEQKPLSFRSCEERKLAGPLPRFVCLLALAHLQVRHPADYAPPAPALHRLGEDGLPCADPCHPVAPDHRPDVRFEGPCIGQTSDGQLVFRDSNAMLVDVGACDEAAGAELGTMLGLNVDAPESRLLST